MKQAINIFPGRPKVRFAALITLVASALVLFPQTAPTKTDGPQVGLILAVDRELVKSPLSLANVQRALSRVLITMPIRVKTGVMTFTNRQSTVVIEPGKPKSHRFYKKSLRQLAGGVDAIKTHPLLAAKKVLGAAEQKTAVIFVSNRAGPECISPKTDHKPYSGPAVHVVFVGAEPAARGRWACLAKAHGGQVIIVKRETALYRGLLRAVDIVVRGGRLLLMAPLPKDKSAKGPGLNITLKDKLRGGRKVPALTGRRIQLLAGVYQIIVPNQKPRIVKVGARKLITVLLGNQGWLRVRCLDKQGRAQKGDVTIFALDKKTVLAKGRCFEQIALPAGKYPVKTSTRPDHMVPGLVAARQSSVVTVDFKTRVLVRLAGYDGRPLKVGLILIPPKGQKRGGMTGRSLVTTAGKIKLRVMTRPTPIQKTLDLAAFKTTEINLGRLAGLQTTIKSKTRKFFVILDQTGNKQIFSGRAGQGYDLTPGKYLVCPAAAKRFRKLCKPIELIAGQRVTVDLTPIPEPPARPPSTFLRRPVPVRRAPTRKGGVRPVRPLRPVKPGHVRQPLPFGPGQGKH